MGTTPSRGVSYRFKFHRGQKMDGKTLFRTWCVATFWLASFSLSPDTADVSAGEEDVHPDELTISVSAIPARLKIVSAEADWGLDQNCKMTIRLVNDTASSWTDVSADGGCTCLKVAINKIPATGITPGSEAIANIVYSKPKQPGLTPRSIKFAINDATVVLPVFIAWQSPVVLRKVEQVEPDRWQVEGVCGKGWVFESVEVVDDDIDVLSQKTEGQRFVVHLGSTLKVDRTTRLFCRVSSSDEKKSVEQVLGITLENDEPRSIPTRLICHINDGGILTGDARLVFPRVRQATRPNLDHSVLLTPEGKTIPLIVSQKNLGKTALRVHFTSESPVTPANLSESSRIRFLFDDDSQLNCPFLVSEE